MRIASFGAGIMAALHLKALEQLGGCELVGTVARSDESASRFARRWGGRPYTDSATMLDRERPEAVWVSVPPVEAPPILERLVERGTPFMVDKPIAVDRAIAERVAAALAQRRVVAAVGYNARGLDFLPEIRARLAERPARMVVGQWVGTTPRSRWWQRREEGGGQMVEQITHLFDLARVLVGEANVVAARGVSLDRAEFPDSNVDVAGAALLQFDSGAIGTFATSCLLDATHTIQLTLICEGTAIEISQIGYWPESIWKVSFDEGRESRVVEARRDTYQAENEAFLAALRANDPSAVLCTYEDGLATLRLTLEVADRS